MSTASAENFWRRCSGGLDELFTIHTSRFAAVTKQRIRTSHFEAHRPLYATSQFDAIADQLKLRGVDSMATSASVREKVCNFLDQQSGSPLYRVGNAAETPTQMVENRIARTRTFQAYLKELRDGERDGDALTLQVACDIFQVKVAVIIPAKSTKESEIALSPSPVTLRGKLESLPTIVVAVSGQWFLQYFSIVESTSESLRQTLYEEGALPVGGDLDAYLVNLAKEASEPKTVAPAVPKPAAPPPAKKIAAAAPKQVKAPSSEPSKKRKREDEFKPTAAGLPSSPSAISTRPVKKASNKYAASSPDESDEEEPVISKPKKLSSSTNSLVTRDAHDSPVQDLMDARFRNRLVDARFANMFRAYLMRFGSGSLVPKQHQAVFWQVYADADAVSKKMCESAAVPLYNELIKHQQNGTPMRMGELRLSQDDISLILRLPSLINQALYVSTDSIAQILLDSKSMKSFRASHYSPLNWWTACADLIMLTWIRDWGLPNDWTSECQKSTFLYMMAGVDKRREICLRTNAPLRDLKPNPKACIDKEWSKFAGELKGWMSSPSQMLNRLEDLMEELTPCFPPDQQRIIMDLKKAPFSAANSSSELVDAMARHAILRYGMEYETKLDSEPDNPIWRIYFDPSKTTRAEFVDQIGGIIQASLPGIDAVRRRERVTCKLGGTVTLTYEDVVRIDSVTTALRKLKYMTDDVAKYVVQGPDFANWSAKINSTAPESWWGPDAEMLAFCYFRDGGLPLRLEEELNTGTLLYEMGALMDEEERQQGGKTMCERIGLARPPIGKLTRQVADDLWEKWLPDFRAWCPDETALYKRTLEFASNLDLFFLRSVVGRPEFADKLPAQTMRKMLLRFGMHPTRDDNNLMIEKFIALKSPTNKQDVAVLHNLVASMVAGCNIVEDRLRDAMARGSGANVSAFELSANDVVNIVKLTEARDRLSSALPVRSLLMFMGSQQYRRWAEAWRPAEIPWFTAEIELCVARIILKHGLPIEWINEVSRLKLHLMKPVSFDPNPLGDHPYYKDVRIEPLEEITKEMTTAIDVYHDLTIARLLDLADAAEEFHAEAKKARSQAQVKARSKADGSKPKAKAKQASRPAANAAASPAAAPASVYVNRPTSLAASAPAITKPVAQQPATGLLAGSVLQAAEMLEQIPDTFQPQSVMMMDYDGAPASKRVKYEEAPHPGFMNSYPQQPAPVPLELHIQGAMPMSPTEFQEPSSAPVEDAQEEQQQQMLSEQNDSMNIDDSGAPSDFSLGEAAAVGDV